VDVQGSSCPGGSSSSNSSRVTGVEVTTKTTGSRGNGRKAAVNSSQDKHNGEQK
jgi:hypothetical protein